LMSLPCWSRVSGLSPSVASNCRHVACMAKSIYSDVFGLSPSVAHKCGLVARTSHQNYFILISIRTQRSFSTRNSARRRSNTFAQLFVKTCLRESRYANGLPNTDEGAKDSDKWAVLHESLVGKVNTSCQTSFKIERRLQIWSHHFQILHFKPFGPHVWFFYKQS